MKPHKSTDTDTGSDSRYSNVGGASAGSLYGLPACDERERLRHSYAEVRARVASIVSEMISIRSTAPKQKYERIQRLLEEAKQARENVYQALQGHRERHGC